MRKIRKIALLAVAFVMVFSCVLLGACGESSNVELKTVEVKVEEATVNGERVLVNVAYGTAPTNSDSYGFRVEGKDNFKKDYVATNMDKDGKFSAQLLDLPNGEFEVRAFVGTTTPDYGKKLAFTGVANDLEKLNAGIEQIDGSFVSAQKLPLGKTCTIKPMFVPENYKYRTVSFESSDTSILTVTKDGVVTAVGKGSATVTVKAKDGKTAICSFQVEEEVFVALDYASVILFKGEQMKLTATVTPDSVTNKAVIWKSRDEDIAIVDQNGYVTAKNEGEVFIEARSVANENVLKTCKVTVAGEYKVILNETLLTLDQGGTYTLTAEIVPSIEGETIVWATSNPSVVTVDNGVIKAVGKGTATITASMRGVSSACEVSVKDDIEVKFILNGDVYAIRYTGASQGYKISMPKRPQDANNSTAPYYFKGWYTTKSYTTEVTENTTFNKATTVYAKLENIFTYTVKSGKVSITGFATGHEIEDIIIPSKIDGYQVYAISSGAFKGSNVETLTIEPGLEKIYDDAFRDCVSLDTVTFKSGSTVSYIGDSVFRDCVALTSISLPTSLNQTGELMFYGCKQLPSKYSELYQLNLESKEYFAPKYTYEFLGQDVMPIGGYIEPSVGYFASGVTVDKVMKDYVASGTNILIGIQQARYGTTGEHYKEMYESLEKYGGMMIERYQVPNAEYLYASYAGSHAEDEPGVVQWLDDLYYNSPWAAGNQVGSQHKQHENWKKNHPRKLRFTNLLPVNSPKNAFVFGATYYGANDAKNHDKFAEYTAKYANYDEYYKTYIEEMKPEVFCYDFYPLWANGGKGYLPYPELNGQHFEQLAVTRYYAEDYNDKVNGGYVPFWNFIQIAQWGAQGEGKGGSRAATLRELNWQVNTALAYGSKGYHYFVFNDYGDISGNGAVSDYAGTTPINIDGTKNTPVYNNVKKLNTQSQAMAKWLLNANVDHIYVYGANPNGEATPTSVLTPRNNSIKWAFKDSVGVNHIVSHMTYYANNNEYDEGVTADVRELYFVCNNNTLQSTGDGTITINFKSEVSGSYIYNGVEKTFSGTSLTVSTVAGEGFAILLDK